MVKHICKLKIIICLLFIGLGSVQLVKAQNNCPAYDPNDKTEWNCNGNIETSSETKKIFSETWCDGRSQWLHEAGKRFGNCGGSTSYLRSKPIQDTLPGPLPSARPVDDNKSVKPVQQEVVTQSIRTAALRWEEKVCRIIKGKQVNIAKLVKFGDSTCSSDECLSSSSLQSNNITEVINIQQPGASIYWLLDSSQNANGASSHRAKYLAYEQLPDSSKPAIAVIMFGTNDSGLFTELKSSSPAVQKWKSDYKRLLSKIESQGTIPILSHVYSVSSKSETLRNFTNGVINEIAGEMGYYVRNLEGVVNKADLVDGIHLNTGRYVGVNSRSAEVIGIVKRQISKCGSPVTEDINLAVSPSNASFLSKKIMLGVVAQPNTEIKISKDGKYDFFRSNTFLLNRTVSVHNGSAVIRGFQDDNSNGVKDGSEKYILDMSEFTLQQQEESISYKLDVGWNAIHLPLIGKNVLTAADYIREANSQGVEIIHLARYVSGVFHMYTNRDGVNFSANFSLIPGEGYFAFTLNSGTIDISGYLPKQQIMPRLNNGWNLIGIYTPNALSVKEYITENNGISVVSELENGLYNNLVRDGGNLYGNEFLLRNNKAYFVKYSNL